MTKRLLIAGVFDDVHVGAHLRDAATSNGWTVELCDATEAFAAPRWQQRWNWWLRGRRPSRLRGFSARVVARAERTRPVAVITTGLAPLDVRALRALAALDVARFNFLTDDPWSARGRAGWFIETLPHYDHVFSPRHANLADLLAAGAAASYLPFAYSPRVHFPDPPLAANRARFDADIAFAGGADAERVAMVAPLIEAGLRVALYGGYWDRDPMTKPFARGFLDAAGVRHAIATARVALCLVRKANRDSHAMRSYEVPAMGGCILAERTVDHEALYGTDGTAALYFDGVRDIAAKAQILLADAALRERLRGEARRRLLAGAHTYADRLDVMVRHVRSLTHV